MISEAISDGDTSTVSATTSGTADLYGYDELPFEYSPVAVSVYTFAKKTNVGLKKLKNITQQSSTIYDLSEKGIVYRISLNIFWCNC